MVAVKIWSMALWNAGIQIYFIVSHIVGLGYSWAWYLLVYIIVLNVLMYNRFVWHTGHEQQVVILGFILPFRLHHSLFCKQDSFGSPLLWYKLHYTLY